MRITEAISRSRQRLSSVGIDEARLDAELLVSEVTGRGRAWLFLHPDEELTPAQTARLEALLSRRLRREPLPYILGRAEFCGLTFRVTPAALIPRPETEILVEAAIERAQGLGAQFIVDVGSGSGAIAVALARQMPQVHVIAADVSLNALRLARENVVTHDAAGRVHLLCSDLLDGLRGEFDCVVANLPYVRADEFPELQPEVRNYEPRWALDGGPDGLELIRRLGAQLLGHLRTGGFAALEVGAGQAPEVTKLLETAGLRTVEALRDYGGIERVVIGWRKG
ncbi:MAG: peptide chain release factor N(5)-glutamine methyltransferase [Armatimonadota bacterium]|jgi:release factor glutamine methyltransferase